jgi:8-oxo-dGTP diphosphatase
MLADEINFCPRCGGVVEERLTFGRLRPTCPNCGWIFFADPKVAVAVLLQPGGKVLLVQRANDPQRGLWTLPAGFVDAGEDPQDAAVRECLEETGLVVRITELLDVLSGQEHPRGAHILIVYRGEILSGNLNSGDDAEKAAFFSLEALPPLAFRTTRRILESLQNS